MKKIYSFFLLLLLITFITLTSCDENSTNPPGGEINDITNPPGGRINRLAINSQGDFFALTNNRLFISKDQGSTWDSLTIALSDLLITSDDYIFVGRYYLNSVFLHRSTDNGNSWTDLTTNLIYLSSINEDQNGNIYVCGTGLQKSTDKGNTWEMIYQGNVRAVCFPNNNTIVIGLPGTFTGQIVYSTNGGLNWDSTGYNVNVMEFYNYDSKIFAGGSAEEEAGEGGVHKSTDAGVHWESCGLDQTQITSFVTNIQNKLFVGAVGGIYFTGDEGETWQKVLSDSIVTTLMQDDNGYLYAGTTDGTFLRSTDNGMSWHN